MISGKKVIYCKEGNGRGANSEGKMVNIPAYILIHQYITELLHKNSCVSQKIPSERELCAMFDVSRTTVRKALQDLIRQGLLQVCHGKGMFLNRKEIQRIFPEFCPPKLVICFGEGHTSYIDGFLMSLISRIFAKLCHTSLRVQIVDILNRGNSAIDELKLYLPDAVLWIRPQETIQTMLNDFSTICPVQLLDGRSPTNLPNISIDFFSAGRKAASWFLDQNIPMPLFLGLHHTQSANSIRNRVYAGWLEEFRRRGIAYQQENHITFSNEASSSLTELLKRKETGGFFCFGAELSRNSEILMHHIRMSGRHFRILTDDTPFIPILPALVPDAYLELTPQKMIDQVCCNITETLLGSRNSMCSLMLDPVIRSCNRENS